MRFFPEIVRCHIFPHQPQQPVHLVLYGLDHCEALGGHAHQELEEFFEDEALIFLTLLIFAGHY